MPHRREPSLPRPRERQATADGCEFELEDVQIPSVSTPRRPRVRDSRARMTSAEDSSEIGTQGKTSRPPVTPALVSPAASSASPPSKHVVVYRGLKVLCIYI